MPASLIRKGSRNYCTGRQVRFGAGGAKVGYSVVLDLPVYRGDVVALELDVIAGTLPLLVGLQAGEKLGLNIDLPGRQVRRGDVVVAQWDRGDLINFKLDCGEYRDTTSGGMTGVSAAVGGNGTPAFEAASLI